MLKIGNVKEGCHFLQKLISSHTLSLSLSLFVRFVKISNEQVSVRIQRRNTEGKRKFHLKCAMRNLGVKVKEQRMSGVKISRIFHFQWEKEWNGTKIFSILLDIVSKQLTLVSC